MRAPAGRLPPALASALLAALCAALACGPGLYDAEGRPDIRAIGPDGGEVRSRDLRFSIVFPPGALAGEVTVTVTDVAPPAGALGGAWVVEPAGTQLGKPATVRIEQPPAEGHLAAPVVARLDEGTLVPLVPRGKTALLGTFAATQPPCVSVADCGEELRCEEGACVPCGACEPACPGGRLCGGSCVDPSNDPGNCGSCGVDCGTASCVEGACRPPVCEADADCGPGHACGATGCACVELCVKSLDCAAGFLCSGLGDGCASCLLACAADGDCSAGEACDGAVCRLACGAGRRLCDGSCSDVLASDANCGACGLACAPDTHCRGGLCRAGACADADGDGYGAGAGCLGPDCDDADPAARPGAVELCDGRDNDCDGGTDLPCPTCTVDTDCGAGEACLLGRCRDGCRAVEICGNGFDDDCDGTVDGGPLCPRVCSTDAQCPAPQRCLALVCQ